ncbi:MAG: hypothetical protein HY996_04725 [Micrococcales bacterium]|nr:hypothetical protein [Micrococcales bacterium]
MRHIGIPEALAVLGLGLVLSIAPPAPPQADAAALSDSGGGLSASSAVQAQPQFSRDEAQTLRVAASAVGDDVRRDSIQATPGERMLIAEGTNASWAKLVMMYGGWPQSESNVTVFLQWMRQENGPDDWWNRNNPLNNGWGSGGGGGFGSYVNLQTGARMAAENLQRPLFSGIASCFAAGRGGCKDAIVASPWAASHYGNGTRWSDRPVELYRAPAAAWAG